MPEPKSPYKRVRRAFVQKDLKRVCEMHETEFGEAYDMDKYIIEKAPEGDDFFFFKDNGSEILAVAHLDTVMPHERRTANFIHTAAGPVIYSGALDDRLGAYTILELLPKLGINYDILLTVGEEKGRSTAEYFEPGEIHDREYNWMIEFDRGGTDCVMYQYEDTELRNLVKETGARTGMGAFSDISYLEHLEIKGVNWGVGYRDYHGPRSHAFLEDYWMMIGHFLKFDEDNREIYLPHEEVRSLYGGKYGGSYSYGGSYGSRNDAWADWERDSDYIDGRRILGDLEDENLALAEEELDGMHIETGDDTMMVIDDDIVSDDFHVVKGVLEASKEFDLVKDVERSLDLAGEEVEDHQIIG